jgi:hypothetical protein
MASRACANTYSSCNNAVVQSVVCVALGSLLLVGAGLKMASWRAVFTTVVATVLLACAFVLPMPVGPFLMGDGTSIIRDRADFEDIVRPEGQVRFSAHLAYRLLDRIDAALGSTPTSPVRSYQTLSWLAGLVVTVSLLCLAATELWSPRAVRYTALSILAPVTLMYFGYLEVGYLALSAAAFPFVARDLDNGEGLTAGLLAGSVLFGLGAAMHGVGYLGIAGMCAAILAADLPIRRRLVLATALGAIAVGAALIWLWYYLAVLGLDVIPHHAIGGAIWKPLWEAREAESRILHPLFSTFAVRDLLLSGFVAGVPLLLVVLFLAKEWRRQSRLALAFTVPSLAFFVFFWPVQGIAIEMDMIVAAFPALYPLLWICAHSVRASLASAALLTLGHCTFWYVVFDDRFINGMIR